RLCIDAIIAGRQERNYVAAVACGERRYERRTVAINGDNMSAKNSSRSGTDGAANLPDGACSSGIDLTHSGDVVIEKRSLVSETDGAKRNHHRRDQGRVI